jgi:hypothetical protein
MAGFGPNLYAIDGSPRHCLFLFLNDKGAVPALVPIREAA